jgi:hypothetical protein
MLRRSEINRAYNSWIVEKSRFWIRQFISGHKDHFSIEWSSSPSACTEGLLMTLVPAKVLAVQKSGDRYQVIVRIETKYRGSFNTLAFGENKPFTGSYHEGRLDLVYFRDPGLEVDQAFPVWTIRRFQSRRYR